MDKDLISTAKYYNEYKLKINVIILLIKLQIFDWVFPGYTIRKQL